MIQAFIPYIYVYRKRDRFIDYINPHCRRQIIWLKACGVLTLWVLGFQLFDFCRSKNFHNNSQAEFPVDWFTTGLFSVFGKGHLTWSSVPNTLVPLEFLILLKPPTIHSMSGRRWQARTKIGIQLSRHNLPMNKGISWGSIRNTHTQWDGCEWRSTTSVQNYATTFCHSYQDLNTLLCDGNNAIVFSTVSHINYSYESNLSFTLRVLICN